MPAFVRHIGIDYSGAQTPPASLKGLRVFMTEGDRPPAEVFAAAVSAQIMGAARHLELMRQLPAEKSFDERLPKGRK